jgi:tetratricopeptide (TPR) repeat protein
LIVVGIVNTNRSRDLTPESANEEETAFWDEVGGAEPFRVFLRDELIPFIDREYRTEPYRILRGQSFGGLLAIHDYMSDAPIFDAVLASSPAIGWNFETLIKAAPAFFADGVPRPIYVASAEKDFPGNLADILEFVRIVDAAAPDPTLWHHESFEGDGHYSLVHQSSYRGLEFLYANWPVPDAIATQADFSLYERHFQELTDRFGYEIRIPLHSIVRLGNGLLRQQRFEEGIAVFERGIQLYPEQPEAHWHMGDALRLAGRIDEARPHFESAYQVAVETSAPDVDDYRETLESLTEAPVQKE